MAHSLSAQKRVRQSAKRNARNRHRKLLLKNDVKVLHRRRSPRAIRLPRPARHSSSSASRLGKKVASKHAIHKNAAARRRSRAAKKLNKLVGAGTKA